MILSSFILPVLASEARVRAGESIRINQTSTSAGGNFALGFFNPGNSTNRYLGIWYKTISEQTVIWVAHRDNLAKNSHGVFGLGDDGNLVLFDGRRRIVWSSNATTANLAMNSTIAVLLDTGNCAWQSFDHPTDTFIPGMRLRTDRKIGWQSLLYSWKDNADPRPGMFSEGIGPEGRPGIFIWKQHDTYWRSSVYDYSLSYVGYKSPEFASYFTFIAEAMMKMVCINFAIVWRVLSPKIRKNGSLEIGQDAVPGEWHGHGFVNFSLMMENVPQSPSQVCISHVDDRNCGLVTGKSPIPISTITHGLSEGDLLHLIEITKERSGMADQSPVSTSALTSRLQALKDTIESGNPLVPNSGAEGPSGGDEISSPIVRSLELGLDVVAEPRFAKDAALKWSDRVESDELRFEHVQDSLVRTRAKGLTTASEVRYVSVGDVMEASLQGMNLSSLAVQSSLSGENDIQVRRLNDMGHHPQ
ncbi:hypothetical protein TEA_008871 [Camellia sinensis var. sinensis]|uniref:Bulb-type lectin domain-containing protein n=1 Tax=Camellia sinensis var. sinensis TaxID=542762 RepID=A0A4S4ED94_CAMSN|nr:hypothetical protein TEA_008871 [Camellia sinensis var. sinensis]